MEPTSIQVSADDYAKFTKLKDAIEKQEEVEDLRRDQVFEKLYAILWVTLAGNIALIVSGNLKTQESLFWFSISAALFTIGLLLVLTGFALYPIFHNKVLTPEHETTYQKLQRLDGNTNVVHTEGKSAVEPGVYGRRFLEKVRTAQFLCITFGLLAAIAGTCIEIQARHHLLPPLDQLLHQTSQK